MLYFSTLCLNMTHSIYAWSKILCLFHQLRCRETEFFYYDIVVNTVSKPSLYKLALFIDCRQRATPASNHVCRHGGEMVSYNNMTRHMSRRHSSQHGHSTPSLTNSRSRTSLSDRGSSATREFTGICAVDSVATPDDVRGNAAHDQA